MRPPEGTAVLVLIKVLHTAVWLAFNGCFALAAWAGLSGRFDAWFWVPVACIFAECAILLGNGGRCPMTPLAARYTTDRHDGFDIYLPRWVARHNKAIYGTLMVVVAIAIAGAQLTRG
jgi:hypothetical protein